MIKRTLFVDTGAWFALADKSDQFHDQAIKIYPELFRDYHYLTTTNLVVAETYNLICRTLGYQPAITFLENLSASPRITKIYSEAILEDKAEKILKEIEVQAREKRFLPIVGVNKGQILVKAIREKKPKRVLEVGSLVGYSAILIGKELKGDAHMITIEIDATNARIAEENIRKAEIPPTVEVLVGDAIKVIPGLNGFFDLSFIDAAKTEYLNYLRLIEDELYKGSVIIADNVGRAPI